jgi:4-azaleucine resistance transporter AzlC
MEKKQMRVMLKAVVIATLPVLTGYVILGIGFGILLSEQGYGPLWALLMGVFIFAGSMQYVAVDLLASAANLVTVAIMTFMVNARHLFYGVSMIERYRGAGKKKPYLIFGLTDETYSLLCDGKVPEGVDAHTYRFFVTLFNHCYWVVGCVLGGILGTVLPFEFRGIEFVLTALFVSIFTEQWLSTKDHLPAVIGVASTVSCLLIFGKEGFLIPSMLLFVLALSVLKAVRKDGSHDK